MFPSIYELPSKERADVIKQQAERDEETSDKIEQDEPASEISELFKEEKETVPINQKNKLSTNLQYDC